MLCPICGNDRFTAILTTRTQYTLVFDQGMTAGSAVASEVASEVFDGGDFGDIEAFTCEDCGEECDERELVTQQSWDAAQEEIEHDRRDLVEIDWGQP